MKRRGSGLWAPYKAGFLLMATLVTHAAVLLPLALLALWMGATAEPLQLLLVGATATYGITTSKTDVDTYWRKVQGPLMVAANFMVPEWDELEQVPEYNIDWSAREITVPLDLDDEAGVASIPEGGFEARPSSVKPVDGTLTWILFNTRWTMSKTARWIDQRNASAMIERQLLMQGRKKLQAMARQFGFYTYGYSTAVMAKLSAGAVGTVKTLKDLYGEAGLGSTTAPFTVTNPFKVGDFVATLNPTGPALRTSGIGKITAVNAATPSITLDTDPTDDAVDDLYVFANSLENTTLAGGTDNNNGLVGFIDAAKSTSVHGVSSATKPKWAAGSDTTGGRLTGVRLMKARHAIEDNGGGDMSEVRYARGVERDLVSYLQAAVRYADPYAMVVDGKPKAEGVRFVSTRFVPEGFAFCYDRRKTRYKLTLLPKPGTPAWGDAKELIDQSGYIFALDYPCAQIWLNRANLYYFSALSQS